MRLKDKVGIVTGGASGIGRSCCILFAREGAQVVVADIDIEGGRETVKHISAQGGEAIFVETNVTSSQDAENLAEETTRAFGGIHVLVNNAGIIKHGTVVDTPEKVWDQVIDVNLKGIYLCSRYVIPRMIKSGGGSIINVSSDGGLIGAADQCAYDAAKAGAINLSRQMAVDFAKHNIRVNSLVPGGIDTPMSRNAIADSREFEEVSSNWGILRRFGTPEEVAYVALFLASDEASFVTGAPFVVDGGYTAE